jgi:hypothetical protein
MMDSSCANHNDATCFPSPLTGEGLPCGVEDFTPQGRGGGGEILNPPSPESPPARGGESS